MGIPEYIALNGAGIAQQIEGNNLSGTRGIPLLVPPYGDEAEDQNMIHAGYVYYQMIHAGGRQ